MTLIKRQIEELNNLKEGDFFLYEDLISNDNTNKTIYKVIKTNEQWNDTSFVVVNYFNINGWEGIDLKYLLNGVMTLEEIEKCETTEMSFSTIYNWRVIKLSFIKANYILDVE